MNAFAKRPRALPLSVVMLAATLCSGMAAAKKPAEDTHAPETPVLQDFSRKISTEVTFKYPANINDHPELAQRLADQNEEIVIEWFNGIEDESAHPFYKVQYELVAQTTHVVAVFGSGSYYEGGAHPQSITESHVWLPEKQDWLTAQGLFVDAEGWQKVSEYVREDIYQQYLSDFPTPSKEDKDWLEGQRDWIKKGTAPDPENFGYFQPLTADNGQIAALRFVFPPYQVGSWADGTWTSDVPASVFYPYLADYYQDVFVSP